MGLDLWRKGTKKEWCQSQDSKHFGGSLQTFFFNSTITNQSVSQNEWWILHLFKDIFLIFLKDWTFENCLKKIPFSLPRKNNILKGMLPQHHHFSDISADNFQITAVRNTELNPSIAISKQDMTMRRAAWQWQTEPDKILENKTLKTRTGQQNLSRALLTKIYRLQFIN